VCLALNSVRAQDPTKVEPKHYRLLFENDRVQVVSVHYGPHEKSEMHDHPGGVVVIVTGGHLRFTDQNGKVTDSIAKSGEARWFPPFKHKVENLGDEPYNAVYVGIKNRTTEVGDNREPGALVNSEELSRIVAEYAGAAAK
jgi:quercetin dioxygenase-like cupin family protein